MTELEKAKEQMRRKFEDMQKWPGGPPFIAITLTPTGPTITSNSSKEIVLTLIQSTMIGLMMEAVEIKKPD